MGFCETLVVAIGASPSGTAETDAVDAASAALDEVIRSHDVVLCVAGVGPLGLLTCPYCTKAMQLLDEKGIPYHVYDSGTKGTASRTALIDRCQGTTSVPEVFVLGTWVGGWDESDGGAKGAPGIEPLMASGTFEEALRRQDASLCRHLVK